MPMIICMQFARSQVYTAYRKLETALYRHAHVPGRHPSPLGGNDPVTSTENTSGSCHFKKAQINLAHRANAQLMPQLFCNVNCTRRHVTKLCWFTDTNTQSWVIFRPRQTLISVSYSPIKQIYLALDLRSAPSCYYRSGWCTCRGCVKSSWPSRCVLWLLDQ